MASATEAASNAQTAATVPAHAQPSNSTARANPRGDQGAFRGHQQNGFRGSRGNNSSGRSRGTQAHGRNNQRNQRVSTVGNRPAPTIPPSPGLRAGDTFGGRQAPMTAGEDSTKERGDQEDDVDAEVCFICASTVVHNSVAPCNHRTCHICALRLRALYKTRACAHCRVSVIYNFETGN